MIWIVIKITRPVRACWFLYDTYVVFLPFLFHWIMKLDSCGVALEHLDTSGSKIKMSEPIVPNLKKIGSLPLFIRFFFQFIHWIKKWNRRRHALEQLEFSGRWGDLLYISYVNEKTQREKQRSVKMNSVSFFFYFNFLVLSEWFKAYLEFFLPLSAKTTTRQPRSYWCN